ncbi:MAG: recombinase family protein [Candidatus Saccharimonadales bacterium]
MTKQIRAAAICRVSTPEQLDNGSLNRQHEAVLKAANELGVVIPDDYWWSGNVSSKKGTNLDRTDLKEIIRQCKKDKTIRYVIVDEPDRFMRSIDEAAYFEVIFRRIGVTVWYACDAELNKGSLASKLFKFTKYLSAEGSNDDRIRQSIDGQTSALKEGRWTFAPKPGYKRGYERGIPEIHPVRGIALQKVLLDIVSKRVTPTQGLKDLNKSEFMTSGHSLYKMDKFRKIVTDPFYAGIVEINKQVKVRNENGLHEALITKEQHYKLIKIMDGKAKNQSGPRENGNPKYPANGTVCDNCLNKRNGRFVGFDHTNGKSPKIYEKYRCRSCNRYLTRQEMHRGIVQQFKDNPITKEGREEFLAALRIVWKQRVAQAEQEAHRINHKIKALNQAIERQVTDMSDPSNIELKARIQQSILQKEQEIETLDEQLEELEKKSDVVWQKFLRFSFDFAENMGATFLEATPENRERCKQIMFPAGFCVNENKKVYTLEISPLITLVGNKKALAKDAKTHMVRVTGL